MIDYEIPCEYSDGAPILRDISQRHGYAQRRALIQYYFHQDPKDSDTFARLWAELFFALQFDGKLKISERRKG